MTMHEIRSGDRITVHTGLARSAHTRKPLARSVRLDVLHARREHDGTIEVYGIELTARGTWRRGVPDRTVILAAGSYTIPIRPGDTVHAGESTGIATVTTIHPAADDGTVTADLRFADGVTSTGHNLATLTHLSHAVPAPDRSSIGLGYQPSNQPAPAPAGGCWSGLCLATNCDGVHHRDADGQTWTDRRTDPVPRREDRYRVRWHRAGQAATHLAVCVVIANYATTDDIPLMIAIREGLPLREVIVDSLSPTT